MVQLNNAGWFDYIRFIFSFLLLIFSAVVTVYAIVEQKTGFWKEIPWWGALLLFFAMLFLLGVVEGLQLALVELKRLDPETYKTSHPAAYSFMEKVNTDDNLERFLMGRQVCVVLLVFLTAKLTSIQAGDSSAFLFPAPAWFRSVFLETGLLASIVVVILAQLTPQIVSALHPLQFTELCLMKPVFYVCIGLEMTGVTHICWIFSYLLSMLVGIKNHDKPDSLRDIDQVVVSKESSINACFQGDR